MPRLAGDGEGGVRGDKIGVGWGVKNVAVGMWGGDSFGPEMPHVLNSLQTADGVRWLPLIPLISCPWQRERLWDAGCKIL